MKIQSNTDIQPYIQILKKSSVFQDTEDCDLLHILTFFQCEIKAYKKDDIIVNIGDPFTRAGLILNGAISGSFFSENSDEINMNHFGQGAMFGEALVFAQIHQTPIQIRVIKDATILFFDFSRLWTDRPKDPCLLPVTVNLLQSLSKRNVFLNQKVRILSQHKLRDRVKVYLRYRPIDKNNTIHIPFSITQLAEFLSVNRSALSRELSHLQNEGILIVSKHAIQILDPSFLKD